MAFARQTYLDEIKILEKLLNRCKSEKEQTEAMILHSEQMDWENTRPEEISAFLHVCFDKGHLDLNRIYFMNDTGISKDGLLSVEKGQASFSKDLLGSVRNGVNSLLDQDQHFIENDKGKRRGLRYFKHESQSQTSPNETCLEEVPELNWREYSKGISHEKRRLVEIAHEIFPAHLSREEIASQFKTMLEKLDPATISSSDALVLTVIACAEDFLGLSRQSVADNLGIEKDILWEIQDYKRPVPNDLKSRLPAAILAVMDEREKENSLAEQAR